jgi:hypothetical protein
MSADHASPLEQAIAEYRRDHPEADDLPDEQIGRLTVVNMRAFGLACNAFGRSLAQAWGRQLRRAGCLY